MNYLNYYYILIGAYGLTDVLIQKNSRTIISSRSKDKTYLPILTTFIFTLFFIPIEYSLFHRFIPDFSFKSGIAVCVIATLIRVKAHLDLREGFSTRVEIQQNHKLVTYGLYSIIRHPLYLAIILILMGGALVLSSRLAWIFIIINLITLKIRIKNEEKFLLNNFSEYKSYQMKTKKLIPFIY